MNRAALFYHPEELRYRFNDEHPFNQQRLELTLDLLKQAKALDAHDIHAFPAASLDDLLLVHTSEFLENAQLLSLPQPPQEAVDAAERWGFDREDTPAFPGMHEAAARIVGGSLAAALHVARGRSKRAFHPGGGLHHAFPNKAAGFCVYNDAAVAIARLVRDFDCSVLYVDTDVHHGDGVQMCFYADPAVCTYSIHETGKYLFPGTGFVQERGVDAGFGTTVNLPLEPYTEDESWLACFSDLLGRTARHFAPDILVSQHGCDAHAWDPLSHVHCSMRIYQEMPRMLRQTAEEVCGGRWVALGGGGYDIWRVVPRAWSLVWLTMNEHPLLQEISGNPLLPLPEGWLREWAKSTPVQLPATWLDDEKTWEPIPRRAEIAKANRRTLDLAAMYLNED